MSKIVQRTSNPTCAKLSSVPAVLEAIDRAVWVSEHWWTWVMQEATTEICGSLSTIADRNMKRLKKKNEKKQRKLQENPPAPLAEDKYSCWSYAELMSSELWSNSKSLRNSCGPFPSSKFRDSGFQVMQQLVGSKHCRSDNCCGLSANACPLRCRWSASRPCAIKKPHADINRECNFHTVQSPIFFTLLDIIFTMQQYCHSCTRFLSSTLCACHFPVSSAMHLWASHRILNKKVQGELHLKKRKNKCTQKWSLSLQDNLAVQKA